MNSGDFEMRITDRRSSGRSLVKRYYGQVSDFSDDIQTIIAEPGDSFPATKIGRSLYDLLKHQFEKRRIETEGFVLRSTVDTKVDAHHFTDMVGWLPSVPMLPFTIDFFNISSVDMDALRSFWARGFSGDVYSQTDEQTDLFLFNKGLFAWRKEKGIVPRANLAPFQKRVTFVPEKMHPVPFWDFRPYADGVGRPENHFILTPYHVETSERRKNFANMIADYLLTSCHNMAQQSP